MTILKCKMCGGDLNFEEGATVVECEYCGTKQTVPLIDDEKKITLFARANRLLFACEFDKAYGVYESIVADFPTEAEAYWGLVLCKYGIEYVDDPATGKKIPTCHRSSFESVMEDDNFDQVMENADPIARSVYREEAKQIEELRRGIIEVSNKEEPYDIFICYKETAENGERTIDSVIAQDVYNELTEKGYRVFFSRITLEDKLGQEYEPYIFAALNSAKIMLAFGTDYEYYNAVWVKNEWSRFLQLIARGEKKTLIPCYKNIDAYDMPNEFAKLQAQDMGKVGAMQDLLRGIEKLLPKSESAQTPQAAPGKETVIVQQPDRSATVDSLLKRAFMYLEDSDWNNAADYCNRVLDVSPENAEAYVGLLMAELQVRKEDELAQQKESFEQNKYFIKAVRFGGEKRRETLEGYRKAVENYVAEKMCKERQQQEEEMQRQKERQHQEEKQQQEERKRQEELQHQRARKDKVKNIMNISGIFFVVLLGLLLLVGIKTKGFGFDENLFDEKCTLILICLAAIMAIMWGVWAEFYFERIYLHSLLSSVIFGMFMLSMFWAFQNYGVNLEDLTAVETVLLTRILFLGPLVFLGIVDWILSLMDFIAREDDWEDSRCRFWRIYKRIFLGIGIVTVYGFWGGCFATENFSAFYSYKTYCYYIITMWAASQLFIYYDKVGKILTALLSHKYSSSSSSSGVGSFNTWKQMKIIKILDKAKTEEQKKKALAKIQKEIKKNQLSALIYGLIYFVNASFLLIACFTLFCDEEDKAVWVKFPGIIAKILEAGNKWILSVPEWILSVSKGNIGALPIWIIYLVAVVTAMIAVPSIAILIARAIIAVFTIRDGSKTFNGTLPECYEKTYMLAKRYHDLDMGSTGKLMLVGFSSAAACIIPFVLFIWMLILEGYFSVEADDDLISNIFSLIIVGVLIILVLCVAIPLLSYISKDFAALEKISFDESDLRVIENFWAEADPEKKAELERLERQKEEELRIWQAQQEKRKREEELSREAWNSSSFSSDSGAISNEEWNDYLFDQDMIEKMNEGWGKDL